MDYTTSPSTSIKWLQQAWPNRKPFPKRIVYAMVLSTGVITMLLSHYFWGSIPRDITWQSSSCTFCTGYTNGMVADNPAFIFLAPEYHNDVNTTDWYFISLRMLGYQLMHAPKTKSRYPFLVAVTPHVDPSKRVQLELDGATIVELPPINVLGHSFREQFRDQMKKLSIFNLYGEYGRLCYIDADNLVLESLDGIFHDPATQIQTTRAYEDEIKDDEPTLPASYVFAGHAHSTGHHDMKKMKRIQDARSPDYTNAGFLVFAPGPEIYEYYMWLANHTDRWEAIWAEQNLYNYAHRKPGNMPWMRLQDEWNVFRPSELDMLRGVKSVHGHLWEEGYKGRRRDIWQRSYDEMTWFYGNRSVLV